MMGLLKEISREKSGVAAIEFALILPFMIMLYFGLAELTQAVRVDRKVNQLTDSLANLTARPTTMDLPYINNIFDASVAVMAPFRGAATQMILTRVDIDAQSNAKVVWSCARNTTARVKNSSVQLPSQWLMPSQTLIMAEAAYFHQPMLNLFFQSPVRLNEVKYHLPRSPELVVLDPSVTSCETGTTNPTDPTDSGTPDEDTADQTNPEDDVCNDTAKQELADEVKETAPTATTPEELVKALSDIGVNGDKDLIQQLGADVGKILSGDCGKSGDTKGGTGDDTSPVVTK